MNMKIAVIGAGGVGGYFGGRLAKAGYNVTFLTRGDHLRAIQSAGLTVKSILGDFHLPDAVATDKMEEIPSPDLVLVCVKAWQIREIRTPLARILHPGSMVIPLQNGVMAADELCESVDRSMVLGGLCRIISKIESPGVINHFGITPFISFGELDRSVTSRLSQVRELLDRAGISCRISEDIEADLWRKFIAICVSGLLAVSRTTYGETRSIPETRKMMTDLLTEIWSLARKIGVNIEDDFVERSVSFIDTFPGDSTSSLTRDVWEGKPSEIEYQNGTVVRLAEKWGVDVPVNRFVYHCILPMEKKARQGTGPAEWPFS
jgi:2-dehydropantoate 2-reductase